MASLKVAFAVAACFAVLVLLNDVAVGVGAECEVCKETCEACEEMCEACKEMQAKCDTCQAEGDKICASGVEASGVCLAPHGECSNKMDTTPACEACKVKNTDDCKKSYYKEMCVTRQKVCSNA